MPECTVIIDSCNSQCPACNTINNGFGTDNILCRRECHTYIECGDWLFMVNGSNHSEYKCYGVWKLHSQSNRFQRMPELTFCSDNSNCKYPAGNTNHHTFRADNFLYWRQCNTYIQCRDKLLMVNGSNLAKHKCNRIRKLLCKNYRFKRMPECSFRLHSGNSLPLAYSTFNRYHNATDMYIFNRKCHSERITLIRNLDCKRFPRWNNKNR
jgi:ribosome-binding factor A